MEIVTETRLSAIKGLYQQIDNRYSECFPDTQDRRSLEQPKTGSSSKKTQLSSHNKSRPTLQIDIETPDKLNFDFKTLHMKSNDKLSSQKVPASHSNVKQRNPSIVAQLKLSSNPPDSVKRFTIKKSIINALEGAANTTQRNMHHLASDTSLHFRTRQAERTFSRNEKSLTQGIKAALANNKQSFHVPSQPTLLQDRPPMESQKARQMNSCRSFATLQSVKKLSETHTRPVLQNKNISRERPSMLMNAHHTIDVREKPKIMN